MDATALAAGKLTLSFYDNSLRWWRYGGHEVLRMVAFVLRDRHWRTIRAKSHRLRHEQHDDGLQISLQAVSEIDGTILDWSLEAHCHGPKATVTIRATPHADIVTNRTGLVVLLPKTVYAGVSFLLETVDGGEQRKQLAEAIAPHQPATSIKRLRFAVPNVGEMSLAFAGDVFEMEDQRNWLDPSYKIYNRSLALPLPYVLPKGETIEQTVAIEIAEAPVNSGRARHESAEARRLPALGVATSPGRIPQDNAAMEHVRELHPAFVLHRLNLDEPREIEVAARFAEAIGAECRLEIIGDADRFVDCANALAGIEASKAIAAVTAHPLTADTKQAFANLPRKPSIGGGTFADFVMLNRAEKPEGADHVAFSLCPTVHADDDRSLIETVESLADVFGQAVRLAGGAPVHAGPCSLRRRLDPSTGLPSDKAADERQESALAAAWTVCVSAAAAQAGVSSLCLYEPAGPRGFFADENTSDGPLWPVFHAVKALWRDPSARIALRRLDPFSIGAFVLTGQESELWIANLSGRALPLPRDLVREARMLVDSEGWIKLPRQTDQGGSANHFAPYAILRIPVDSEDQIASILSSFSE